MASPPLLEVLASRTHQSIYGEKPGAARYDAAKPVEYVNSEGSIALDLAYNRG
ncbi:MAG: hypothetical protein FWG14_12210 [Peptococcaceae bacterium]|nr:hypothetical protein [Peptococcaceae bacterium]